MGDIRLNDLMALHIHKDSTDELDLIDFAKKLLEMLILEKGFLALL